MDTGKIICLTTLTNQYVTLVIDGNETPYYTRFVKFITIY